MMLAKLLKLRFYSDTMIRIFQLLSIVTILAGYVQSVFIEDAFTKNWVLHNHANIVKYDAISESLLFGITEKSELIGYNISESLSLAWKVDTPLKDIEYTINGDIVATYSPNGDEIFVWNAQSGQLVNQFELQKIKYVAPSLDGFIVLSNSDVYQVNSLSVTKIADGVKNVVSAKLEEETHLVCDSTYLKLDKSLETSKKQVSINAKLITAINSHFAIANGKVVDLTQDKVVNSAKVDGLLSDDFSYSFVNKKLKIYKGDKVVSENEFESNDIKILDHYMIIAEPSERKVIDLKDFFKTAEEASIVLESYIHTTFGKDYVFGDDIVSVEVNGRELTVSTYDISKDLLVVKQYNLKTYDLSLPAALLINKPESEDTLESIQHLVDEIQQNNFLLRLVKRTRRHLVELGKFFVSKVTRLDSYQNTIEITNPYDLEKLLIFVDGNELVATDSLDGEEIWRISIKPGVKNILEDKGQIVLEYEAASPKIKINARDGKEVSTDGKEVADNLNNEALYVKQVGDSLQGYKVGDSELILTWKFLSGRILATAVKPNTETVSVGIGLHDGSVLYKYLNPNTVGVVTKKDSVKLYLLDAESGAIVYSHEHPSNEVIDLDSIKLIVEDNWIIYSYFVEHPKYEQRIQVVDLFGSKPTVERINSTISSSYTKSFIYPERIVDLKLTYTRFGITLKSIIVLTEDGDLVELPKFILNSRRIDDKPLTKDDFKDDFRMMPYEPVISRNNYQILNHQHKLEVDKSNLILIKDTKLESTAIVCLVNSKNQFCTRVQPSLGFDVLGESFQKSKLIMTVLMLIVAYFITVPMVTKKKLNNQWTYTL